MNQIPRSYAQSCEPRQAESRKEAPVVRRSALQNSRRTTRRPPLACLTRQLGGGGCSPSLQTPHSRPLPADRLLEFWQRNRKNVWPSWAS